jgi:cell wall-associated NlpC family hydrolase
MAVVSLVTPAAAIGTPPAPAGSIAGDRAEATMLAAQIRADGQRLGQLAEQADAAQIRSQQLGGRLVAARQRAAQLAGQLAVTRQHLRAEAVAAYVNGNVPEYAQRAGQPGLDPSLTTGYARVVSTETKQTIKQFVTLVAEQAVATRQLRDAKKAADASLALLRADQKAAEEATATEERALNGVNAELRSLVAAAQAAQARAMAAQEQARLASERQLPPPSRVVTVASVRSVATTTAPSRRAVAAAPARPARSAAASPTAAAPPPPRRLAPPPTVAPAPPPTVAPAPPSPPPSVGNSPAPGASVAIGYAYAQVGKPYAWGGAGPGAFDCSGLVMMAWAAAGVYFPHLAQDQYDMTRRISLSQLLPGDLVFFGTPSDVTHVGIYVGGGEMIDAPSTGNFVRVESIYWSDLLGAGRV